MVASKIMLRFVLTALLAVTGSAALCDDVQEGFERIQFTPGRDAAIRTKSNVVRGLLLGLTRDTVYVETGAGTARAKMVDIPLKTISSIRTSDGEFQYKSGDDFTRVCEYATRLDGVTIQDARVTPAMASEKVRQAYGLGPATPNPSPGVNRPPEGGFQGRPAGQMSPAEQSTTIGGFANSGGFGGVGTSGTPPVGTQPVPSQMSTIPTPSSGKSEPDPAASNPVLSSYGVNTTPPVTEKAISSEGTFARNGEIVTCSNCGKEVAYNSTYGMRCPHCNIQWVADTPGPDASDSQTGGSGQMDLAQAGQPAAHIQAVQGDGGPQVPVQLPPPPPPTPAATQTAPQDFDLATLPLWMKATLFCASIGLIYYFAFYLR